MSRATTIALLICIAGPTHAQDIPLLRPVSSSGCDLSTENFARYTEFDRLMAMEPDAMDSLDVARYEALLDEIGDAGPGTPCQILGTSCSWYCGGGPEEVTATSQLQAEADSIHTPWNAHDLNYCTAWCEGVEGPGIGERLIYRFTPESPRLHTIIVVNGFVQDSVLWAENNRVKELLVTDNGVPVARLALEDTMDDQSFSIGLLGQHPNGSPMELTFEISAIHPGTKHDRTAITEIYFDGTDVH